jgi:hypothetical protein
MEIANYKRTYLKRYNPEKSVEVALSKALNAAVGHNRIYAPKIGKKMKDKVRELWKDKLKRISKKYTKKRKDSEYEKDIVNLKKQLLNSIKSDIPYFKVSHAQKSMAVFLKHMWCMNLISTPPQCPIDRIILTKLGKEFRVYNWTQIDNIQIHKEIVRMAKAKIASKNLSLAEWELINFQ